MSTGRERYTGYVWITSSLFLFLYGILMLRNFHLTQR